MSHPAHIFRVLYEACPAQPDPKNPGLEHALLSITVSAADIKAASRQAREMLGQMGWLPKGQPMGVSDLTRLLQEHPSGTEDSAFGEWAAAWLQELHDDTIHSGTRIDLLSVDYETLPHPRRLHPF